MNRAWWTRIARLLRTPLRRKVDRNSADLRQIRAALATAAPPPGGTPPALVLAASAPCRASQAVTLTLPGGDPVIAVLGPEGGDPDAIWQAICGLAARELRAAAAITALPGGLHAALVACQGLPVICVSPALGRPAQLAAVRAARRARPVLPPLPVPVPPPASRWCHPARARVAALSAAAVAAVAVLTAVPDTAAPSHPPAAVHRHCRRRPVPYAHAWRRLADGRAA